MEETHRDAKMERSKTMREARERDILKKKDKQVQKLIKKQKQ